MEVSSIMTDIVVSVELDDPLSVVKKIFDHTLFHHLMVVRDDKLYGILSDRDLLKALNPRLGTLAESSKDLACLNKKVHQIMTRHPITLEAHANVRDAVVIFNEHNISCIPVIDSQSKPIGVISWRDIMRVIEI